MGENLPIKLKICKKVLGEVKMCLLGELSVLYDCRSYCNKYYKLPKSL